MTVLWLALCLSLIAYGVVAAAVGAAARVLGPVLTRRLAGDRSAVRARAYLMLRLAPSALAAAVAGTIFLPAFLAHEPRAAGEAVGLAIVVPAGLVALVIAHSVARTTLAWYQANSLRRRWLASARRLRGRGANLPVYAIQSRFPLIAVVGIWRPVLVISERVLAACPSVELDAILAHESAHVDARDNLKRVLLQLAPDFAASTRYGRHLCRDWAQAAEEAADARAGTTRDRAHALALALIRVSRLAADTSPPPALVAALTRGGDVSRRVERLACGDDGAAPRPARDSRWWLVASLATWAAVAASPLVRRNVHAVAEAFVTWLQ